MRICVNIDKVAALLAGSDKCGYHIVEIPAADMTERQRQELAKHASCYADCPHKNQAEFFLTAVPYDSGYLCHTRMTEIMQGIVTGTPQEVLQALDQIADLREATLKEREEKAKLDKERTEKKIQDAYRFAIEVISAGLPLVKEEYGMPQVAWPWNDHNIVSRFPVVAAKLEEDFKTVNNAIKQRQEARKQEEADREAALAREERTWIQTHGSSRLRRCLQEGIKYKRVYLDERLDFELPDWDYYCDIEESTVEAINPPDEAFVLLDAARAQVPDAILMYLQETKQYVATAACPWSRGPSLVTKARFPLEPAPNDDE